MGEREEVEGGLRTLVAKQLAIDEVTITLEATLKGDLKFDSLDTAEVGLRSRREL